MGLLFSRACRHFGRLFAALILVGMISVADPAASQTVRFSTTLGNIDVILAPSAAPKTVANFLNYVKKGNNGGFDGTFIHRDVPGFVLQGGGYTFTNGNPNTLPADPPVVNEFKLSNIRGTIAMAKVGNDPNSATSQWFFNLADNSSTLDNQNGGFTVFGQVADAASLSVMDRIAALQVYNLGSPFDQIPLTNYSGSGAVSSTNLIFVNSVTTLSAALGDYAITASPNTVNITAGQSGTTMLTVTPVNSFQGTVTFSCGNLPASASCTFSPASLSFAAGATVAQTTTLTINTTSNTTSLPNGVATANGGGPPFSPIGSGSSGVMGAVTIASLMGLAFVAHRQRWPRGLPLGLAAAALASCGGGSQSSSLTVVTSPTPVPTASPTPTSTVTPKGTYTVPVTVSSGSTTHPINLTVVVQ